MNEPGSLTALEVMAQADSVLIAAGYRSVVHDLWNKSSGSARAYEDPYGVVALFVFDTVTDLVREWPSAQADLVSLLSEFVSRDDDKAWDGYLVLVSPAMADIDLGKRLDEIRRDTARVRKLVATGRDLGVLSDVDRALLSLLPFDSGAPAAIPGSALDALPGLLATHGIPLELTQEMIRAFNQQTSLMRALNGKGAGQ